MNSDTAKDPRSQNAATQYRTKAALRRAGQLAVIVFVALPAFAQYGGTTGMGSSAPSYGHFAAIGIGVGAAAAGAVGVYFLTHRSSTVSGCVVKGDSALLLTDEKSKRTFELLEGSSNVNTGERMELKGKVRKTESGNPRFEVKSVAKDLGECRTPASAAADIPAVAQSK